MAVTNILYTEKEVYIGNPQRWRSAPFVVHKAVNKTLYYGASAAAAVYNGANR